MAARTIQPLLRLLRYGKPYQVQIWGAIACSILNTIFDLAAIAAVEELASFMATDGRV